jgi:hypothetical protein
MLLDVWCLQRRCNERRGWQAGTSPFSVPLCQKSGMHPEQRQVRMLGVTENRGLARSAARPSLGVVLEP